MKNNVIYNIIELINSDNYYGVSNNIELCKGKNKLCSNFKEKWEQRKRRLIFLYKK